HLGLVLDAVVVGVGVTRVRVVAELAEVLQTVLVRVAPGVGVVGVEVVADLPVVGHAVVVGVADVRGRARRCRGQGEEGGGAEGGDDRRPASCSGGDGHDLL